MARVHIMRITSKKFTDVTQHIDPKKKKKQQQMKMLLPIRLIFGNTIKVKAE